MVERLQYISSYFPITDPTWIFFIVLGIILFAPIIFGRLRIPHIIGMILAGVVIGEHGLNIISRDSSFQIFGNVGLLYIMFLAGLEMNMSDFKQTRSKAIIFGLLGFIIPMTAGYAVNSLILKYSAVPALLIASMYASHTLVSYPIVSRYGVAGQRSVSISVGATAITDCLTLFLLAILGGLYKGEEFGSLSWAWLVVKVAILTACVIFFFPRIGRWFFRRYNNAVLQYIFVMSMMFLSAGLMKIVGMEGILGAFLAGLVLNRLIPNVSTLMHNVEFVGNALFIPYFLIGVGMMINLRVFFGGWSITKLLIIMVVMAIVTKWLTAWITQKVCRMTKTERSLMYGLSTSRAAATLAVALVGYNIILPDNSHLLSDEILNGAIALILITCIVSGTVTQRAARKMALTEMEANDATGIDSQRLLIAVANPETLSSLVSLALLIRDRKVADNLVAVNVVSDNDNINRGGKAARIGKRHLERAAQLAVSAGTQLKTISRYSANVTTGVIHTAKEQDATTTIVGLHHKLNEADTAAGPYIEAFLSKLHEEIIILRALMPFNTMRRIVVVVPPKAQFEPGFSKWMNHIINMSHALGCRMHFHGNNESLKFVKIILSQRKAIDSAKLIQMDSWDGLMKISTGVNYDHLIVIISARNGGVSYQPDFSNLTDIANRYFSNCSTMIIYPDQTGEPVHIPGFSAPLQS